jgi:hypothetical protein
VEEPPDDGFERGVSSFAIKVRHILISHSIVAIAYENEYAEYSRVVQFLK